MNHHFSYPLKKAIIVTMKGGASYVAQDARPISKSGFFRGRRKAVKKRFMQSLKDRRIL